MSPFKLIKNNKPIPLLIKLFDALEIEHDNNILTLNKLAQEKFLRKPGQERWHMPELYAEKKDRIMPILKELGVISEVFPVSSSYDFIFIHGGFISRMRKRLYFLDQLWSLLETKETVKIVILSGKRDLDPIFENNEAITKQELSLIPFQPTWKRTHKIPKTEGDLAPLLWDQIISHPNLQSKIEKNDVLFVDAPIIEKRRPNTKGTFDFWFNSWKNPDAYPKEYQNFWMSTPVSPDKARYLAISDNPFLPYQDWVLRNIIKKENLKEIRLETVGPAADPDLPIPVHLDNIARWLYEETHSLKI